MKIATAAYPLDVLTSWAQYEDKLAHWVAEAAVQGAELLVFPEYAAMELATLDGAEVAADLERSLFSVSDKLEEADRLHMKLATEHNVHIVAGSGPAATESRPVNRARLITPTGQVRVQDKQIMTRFEREEWGVIGGNALQVFETAIGKIGILICYDSEFPLLGRALSDCDVICVPSVTETLAGYWRVRIGSMARARWRISASRRCLRWWARRIGQRLWVNLLARGGFSARRIAASRRRAFWDCAR